MKNSKLINNNDKKLDIKTRTEVNGLESKVVNTYIDFLRKRNEMNKEKKIIIFVEPNIASGYPDLVIVEYRQRFINELLKRDKDLNITDLKILFELFNNQGQEISFFERTLGFSKEEINKSVDKIINLKLARKNNKGSIYVNKLKLKKSITNIISIEAKINNWSEALNQAIRNSWFSSESYIMLNKDSCDRKVIDKCKSEGVGIILVNGNVMKILKSSKRPFPVSYGSLQFWEWMIRKEIQESDN